MMFRAGVLTVSDSAAAGTSEDLTGPTICRALAAHGFEIVGRKTVADERSQIQQILLEWTDRTRLDLIVTTGGTGLSPRDVTPEATLPVLEKTIPGIGEAMRARGLLSTPTAILSRGVAGIRGQTLIVNLPGSPGAVQDGLDLLLPVLHHALKKIQGDPTPCQPRAFSS